MPNDKILIAMSGGVDSSVAAYLQIRSGSRCGGITLRLWDNGTDTWADAAAVARRLGMDFSTLDARALFRSQVVEDFVCAYEQGLTPNPCIRCNRHLKFSFLLEKALEQGYDAIATGHYARIQKDTATGRYLLYKATDLQKDQSYFLACLTQHQLAHSRFPLGTLSKEEVRAIAEAQGFLNARKKDSQDVCFIPDGDYLAFMEGYRGRAYPAGDFLDPAGNILGRHKGAAGYTLGQRKGLGIAMGVPVYVCGKDMAANTVTVGPESALFTRELLAKDWVWGPFEALTSPLKLLAKARSRHIPQTATVYPEENGTARVVFDAPQRAITPGQTVVLYDGDLVVGSGTIL